MQAVIRGGWPRLWGLPRVLCPHLLHAESRNGKTAAVFVPQPAAYLAKPAEQTKSIAAVPRQPWPRRSRRSRPRPQGTARADLLEGWKQRELFPGVCFTFNMCVCRGVSRSPVGLTGCQSMQNQHTWYHIMSSSGKVMVTSPMCHIHVSTTFLLCYRVHLLSQRSPDLWLGSPHYILWHP